jgi:hypothetical protein
MPSTTAVQRTKLLFSGVVKYGKRSNELEKEEKSMLLKLIKTFVSKKRFKDYLQKKYCCSVKAKHAKLLSLAFG